MKERSIRIPEFIRHDFWRKFMALFLPVIAALVDRVYEHKIMRIQLIKS